MKINLNNYPSNNKAVQMHSNIPLSEIEVEGLSCWQAGHLFMVWSLVHIHTGHSHLSFDWQLNMADNEDFLSASLGFIWCSDIVKSRKSREN